jgi:hypothetical protein
MNLILPHTFIRLRWYDKAYTITNFIAPTREYQAPFTLQNRETEYATIWAKLEENLTSPRVF